jgi:hypothetical protein
MKLKANNFRGNKNFDYKVEIETIVNNGITEVTAFLHIKLDGHWNSVSAAQGEFTEDYKYNLKTTLLRAEEKFGIDLLSIDIDNLKSA